MVAEFTGFETSPPREVRVRAGDNRLTIVLALARLKDEVVVGRDQQEAGSDRASTFGSMLTRDQIDQLSDDPAIVRQQLEDLAGPGCQILIDSFEGGQLPNKSQIRSIRISRDQFAAESHSAGGIRIEIVTQPGQGDIRGQARTNFYTSRMDGSNPLVNRAPPAQNRQWRDESVWRSAEGSDVLQPELERLEQLHVASADRQRQQQHGHACAADQDPHDVGKLSAAASIGR